MQNSVSESAPYEPRSPIAAATAPYNSNEVTTIEDKTLAFQSATPACSYDEVFPALPESATPIAVSSNHLGQMNNKMRIGSSTVTQIFVIPYERRKLDHSENFGESESMRTCANIMQLTHAHIEISSSRDQSLTFLVHGKTNDVADARRRILTHFQAQVEVSFAIPKDHHRFLLGKGGKNLMDMEKRTGCKINIPNMNDKSELITVIGPKEGTDKAVHEIKVLSDEQSKQAYEKIEVPKIYHPFICGAYNENLNSLIGEKNVRVNVPPQSVQKDEITIAGEKDGVQYVKDKILAIYEEMKKKCSIVSVEVPKSQHKYVIGPRGNTLQTILQTTGVSVEMPPSDSSSDTITLRGPQDKLGMALSTVYEKANSFQTVAVDVPSWLHKYIIGRKGANIRQLTQDLPKVHVEFTDKDKIKIEGPPEEVEKAQSLLEEHATKLKAELVFEELPVDPKFYKHIIGKSGANVNRLKEQTGVTINIGEDDGSTTNIIRIEGSKEGVETAKKELKEMVSKLENEVEKDVIIGHRFHATLIGTKGDKVREIREKYNQVQIFFPNLSDRSDVVKIRGPREDVEKCRSHIMRIVKDLEEESYMLEVPIYKQFHKFIIGKGGANIRKIRDETQTKIDLPSEGDVSDVIRITGKEENVKSARDRIQKIQSEQIQIVTEEITIPPKFYNSLIGSGGKLIHSISEECGRVQIRFPNAESKSDKVMIRGPKEDVEKAKQQLSDLKNEREAASFTAEVRAKPQHHKFLIGKNGANIKKIRDMTGARIVFPSDKDDDKEIITIMGKKDQVEQARQELERTIKDIDNTTESEMIVPHIHHKHFVARRGTVLHKIAEDCGGVMISFPRPNVDSDKVSLKGAKDCIEAAKRRIEEIVRELESMVTIQCIIPQKLHRTVMGPQGKKVQNITSEFNVQIKFPDRETEDEMNMNENEINGEDDIRVSDIIRITGKQDNCEAAKEALLQLVPITIEVPVPYDLHRSIIGKSGLKVRELMKDYDVHIILSPADQKIDCIKISGAPANVENAKEALEKRVEQLEKEKQDRILKSFQLTLEVDPEYHPKIIGRRGAIITKIREEYGVAINLPKKGEPEEHIITITGYEDKAIAARDHILGIVNNLKEQYKEGIDVDSRVHSRLIGVKGRTIRKVMEEYQVDVKFPRQGDSDPNLVVISGAMSNVLEAKDYILNLAEEYIMDVNDSEYLESLNRPPSSTLSLGDNRGQGDGSQGFVVRGGPWEQRRPDTASIEDFPSFGSAGAGEGPPTATWVPHR